MQMQTLNYQSVETTKVKYHGSEATKFAAILGAGLMFGSFIMADVDASTKAAKGIGSFYQNLSSHLDNGTLQRARVSLVTSPEAAGAEKNFTKSMNDVYVKLAARQQSLGVDFSEFIEDRIWDIYAT